jgi:acetyltransferase
MLTMSPATTATTDLAHDVLHQERQPLDVIFKPKSVAVIGATETAGAVGRTVLWNVVSSPFGGTVYPVNPKRPSILGIKAYPSITALPEKVDLIVVCTPAPSVPAIVAEAVACGVKGAVIISAGFKEIGPEGVKLEQEVLAIARQGKMRIIGPNCLGVMNPIGGLNASFAGSMAKPGNVAFLSQSGALMTAVLDWSLKEQVGFSGFASVGSMLDVNWGDLIDYYGNDPKTHSILIYMETIGDARSFLSAAREVALTKPIIVIKPGRTDQAAKAAASHTGSLTGGDDVVEAAFRRSGVLRVNNISDLFYMAEVLAKQPRPKGPRLTVLTNAGGPAVLAVDALITSGGELTTISKETIEKLNTFLPASWSHGNPVDILGDAKADRYAKTLELCAEDPNSDGLLVILTPQDMTEPTETAELLTKYAKIEGKPVLAAWMGGPVVEDGEHILNQAGIPTFPYPDTAARAFYYMWRYTYNLRGLYETPAMDDEDFEPKRDAAQSILAGARGENRTILTEDESKNLLATYGIPTVPTDLAATADAAVELAKKTGFPVVLKLYSKTITHKTDVGGVKLNLIDAAAVRDAFEAIQRSVSEKASADQFQGVTVQPMIKLSDAYELILGSSIDPQFGPVLLFGTGGQLVEVFKDRALALPPLNVTLARRMIEQTKIYTALKGVRGREPVDLAELEQLLVRFSRLVIEQPRIKEIDINPLLASPDRFLALDARVVLHPESVPDDKLPKPAIRPYPTQYATDWRLNDGEPVRIRPIRPEDEPLMVQFHKTLSEQSVRSRYFHPMKLDARTAHDRLIRVTFNDFDRELALVVEHRKPDGDRPEILAVGRLSKTPGLNEAEFALIVSDEYQHLGIGTKLLEMLVQIGRIEKLGRISAQILNDNIEMQKTAEKAGFKLSHNIEEGTYIAEMELV